MADVRALILESRIRAKYDFNENVGLIIGLNYFDVTEFLSLYAAGCQ